METYNATSLPIRGRAAAWNELHSSLLDRAEFIPDDQNDFEAELKLADLGPIRIARMNCGSTRIERTSQHVAQSSSRQVYSFILQARGRGVFTHYGREAALGEGDFTLCNNIAPHSFRLDDDSEVVMLRVPANIAKEHLPSPDYFCGRHLSASEGLTQTASTVTLSLCTQLEVGLASEFQERVARHLLDIIATSYAIAFDSLTTMSPNISGRYARVKLYIEQHLRDPELSPSTIATKLKLSSRYLRMIFACSSETLSAYILRRRLEECSKQISDPRWRAHSITEIAFAWGFNSAPHFTRSFRERYNISPRRYRQLQLETLAVRDKEPCRNDESHPMPVVATVYLS